MADERGPRCPVCRAGELALPEGVVDGGKGGRPVIFGCTTPDRGAVAALLENGRALAIVELEVPPTGAEEA